MSGCPVAEPAVKTLNAALTGGCYLHLLVPGLFGPMPGLDAAGAVPRLPALETLLARAERSELPGADLESTLFGLFGVRRRPGGDWPSAPVCRLADTAAADDGFWLHADPVFLRPDKDRLLLFDSRHLGISRDEADRLVALLNAHFGDLGWRFEMPRPGYGYVRVPGTPCLATSPLSEVIGRSIDAFLPTGSEAGQWRTWLNEMQMLLHQADSNLAREAAGRLPVNSLWLWGGGVMPEVDAQPFQQVFSDLPLARGLALLAGLEPSPVPARIAETPDGPGAFLLCFDGLLPPVLDADPSAWRAQLERLEAELAPLLSGLRRQRPGTIALYPCNGSRYRLEKAGLRRFWRRRRALGDLAKVPS